MSDIENPAGDTRPIGVFDSGLGGLTVARAIATALPRESVYYLATPSRCPYGTRTEDEVRSFALQAGRWLSKHDVKIMVIACNTATAAALRLAQQVLDVPVIGVIAPGARAAINSTRSRRVGVLATNLTIRSGAYTRAIQDLDAGVDVYGCPASSFVEVVEHELASGAHLQEQWLENEDIFDTPAVRALVGATVEPLRDHGIDTWCSAVRISAVGGTYPPRSGAWGARREFRRGDHTRVDRYPHAPRAAGGRRRRAAASFCHDGR